MDLHLTSIVWTTPVLTKLSTAASIAGGQETYGTDDGVFCEIPPAS
jgi:hypothetical protein